MENLASNKDNFNYLIGNKKQDNTELGDDTSIDITNYLKSPGPFQVNPNIREAKLTSKDEVKEKPNKIDERQDDAPTDIVQVEVIENLI